MSDVVPLPVWPHGLTPERDLLLRRAKRELGLDFCILPCPAVPASPGRVLAFGSLPDFLCEAVLIRPENTERYESVLAALRFTLTAPAGTPGAFDEGDYVRALMPGAVEVERESYEKKKVQFV